eukprot:365041-Chlamydomonas_euryale.AAC.11
MATGDSSDAATPARKDSEDAAFCEDTKDVGHVSREITGNSTTSILRFSLSIVRGRSYIAWVPAVVLAACLAISIAGIVLIANGTADMKRAQASHVAQAWLTELKNGILIVSTPVSIVAGVVNRAPNHSWRHVAA